MKNVRMFLVTLMLAVSALGNSVTSNIVTEPFSMATDTVTVVTPIREIQPVIQIEKKITEPLPVAHTTAKVNSESNAAIKSIVAKVGLTLCGVKSTAISQDLTAAIRDYTGPAVRITSLKRHWGTSSKHEIGRAIDFELSRDLVSWLCTLDGIKWREKHNLKFYIEGKPRCSALDFYIKDELYSQFVFFNRKATGPHIHIEIV